MMSKSKRIVAPRGPLTPEIRKIQDARLAVAPMDELEVKNCIDAILGLAGLKPTQVEVTNGSDVVDVHLTLTAQALRAANKSAAAIRTLAFKLSTGY